jgi:hypothetical protein
MRWLLLCLGSLASGMLTIIVSLVLLLVFLSIYDKYVLGIASEGLVPTIRHLLFMLLLSGLIAIPVLIFALGCFVGYWFLQKRLVR